MIARPHPRPHPHPIRAWIIFCRVVDHFGDAGFCWRLCLALADRGAAHGIGQVTLVIDAPDVLQKIQGPVQQHAVRVLDWESVSALPQADVVIEAFGCNPPQAFIESLKPGAISITLDYLATEAWADQTHGRPSPRPNPLAHQRYWFNPGFSKKTGGLLHGQWRHISKAERQQWRKLLINAEVRGTKNQGSYSQLHSNNDHNTNDHSNNDHSNVFLVLAFGYPDAPWAALKEIMQQHLPAPFTRVVFWQPKGLEYSQTEFDQILQACDLNFVRGEDSFVRAHWAAAGPWQVPFIWQPYRQEQNAHEDKLAGWAQSILRLKTLAPLHHMHWSWNHLGGRDLQTDWKELVGHWQAVRHSLHRQCLKLAGRAGLEDQLIKLVKNVHKRHL
jgi:uncharacterized repeat protein (TIGR03837 family)